MNKETRESIQTIIGLILIISGIFAIGRAVGHYNGYMERMEDESRSECQADNSNKPYNEVEVKCIKYFVEETE